MRKAKPVSAELIDLRSEVQKVGRAKGGDHASEEIVQSFVIRRALKFYPITDSEFENLAYINTLFNILLAAGPLLAGVGATAILSLFTIDHDKQQLALGAYGATGVLSLVGAVVIFFFAQRAYMQRKDLLTRWKQFATIAAKA